MAYKRGMRSMRRRYRKYRKTGYIKKRAFKAPLARTIYAGGAANNQTSTKITLRFWELMSSTFTPSNPVEYRGYAIRLADFNNASTITNNFDQYKIVGVRLTFYPCVGTEAEPDANSISAAVLHICNDFDDAGTPSTLNEIQSRSSYRIKNLLTSNLTPFSWALKPVVTATVLNSAGGFSNGEMVTKSPWINTSGGAGVNYYGIKLGIEGLTYLGLPPSTTSTLGVKLLWECDVIARGLTKIA